MDSDIDEEMITQIIYQYGITDMNNITDEQLKNIFKIYKNNIKDKYKNLFDFIKNMYINKNILNIISNEEKEELIKYHKKFSLDLCKGKILDKELEIRTYVYNHEELDGIECTIDNISTILNIAKSRDNIENIKNNLKIEFNIARNLVFCNKEIDDDYSGFFVLYAYYYKDYLKEINKDIIYECQTITINPIHKDEKKDNGMGICLKKDNDINNKYKTIIFVSIYVSNDDINEIIKNNE